MNSGAPTQTSMCGRSPAHDRRSRSNPIAPPNSAAASRRMTTSVSLSMRVSSCAVVARQGTRLDDAGSQQGVQPSVLRVRSEEHTSELQSLMRNSYAVFCLKNKKEITAARDFQNERTFPTHQQSRTTHTTHPTYVV